MLPLSIRKPAIHLFGISKYYRKDDNMPSADFDVKLWTNLFQNEYGFTDIRTLSSETNDRIKRDTLRDFLIDSRRIIEDKDQHDALIIIGSCHGLDNEIKCYHGSMRIDTIMQTFNSDQCKNLRGKPKILILDCCRGKKTKEIVNDHIPRGPYIIQQNDKIAKTANGENWYIIYACQEGYEAFHFDKGKYEGGHLTRSLIKLLKENRDNKYGFALVGNQIAMNNIVNKLSDNKQESVVVNTICLDNVSDVYLTPVNNVIDNNNNNNNNKEHEMNKLKTKLKQVINEMKENHNNSQKEITGLKCKLSLKTKEYDIFAKLIAKNKQRQQQHNMRIDNKINELKTKLLYSENENNSLNTILLDHTSQDIARLNVNINSDPEKIKDLEKKIHQLQSELSQVINEKNQLNIYIENHNQPMDNVHVIMNDDNCASISNTVQQTTSSNIRNKQTNKPRSCQHIDGGVCIHCYNIDNTQMDCDDSDTTNNIFIDEHNNNIIEETISENIITNNNISQNERQLNNSHNRDLEKIKHLEENQCEGQLNICIENENQSMNNVQKSVDIIMNGDNNNCNTQMDCDTNNILIDEQDNNNTIEEPPLRNIDSSDSEMICNNSEFENNTQMTMDSNNDGVLIDNSLCVITNRHNNRKRKLRSKKINDLLPETNIDNEVHSNNILQQNNERILHINHNTDNICMKEGENEIELPKKKRRLNHNKSSKKTTVMRNKSKNENKDNGSSNNNNKQQRKRINNFENSYCVSVDCHLCKKHFDKFGEYKNHLNAHYQNDENKKWLKCDLGCKNNVSAHQFNFIAHIATHTKQYPFQCAKCTTTKSSKGNMKMHWNEKHNDDNKNKKKCSKAPFKCNKCGKEFPGKYRLNGHMRIHKIKKLFKCNKCGKEFPGKRNLNGHMRIHKRHHLKYRRHQSIRFI